MAFSTTDVDTLSDGHYDPDPFTMRRVTMLRSVVRTLGLVVPFLIVGACDGRNDATIATAETAALQLLQIR